MFSRPEIHGVTTEIDKLLLKIPKPALSDSLVFYQAVFKVSDSEIAE